jgi:5-formyltetrahydrofolate cyclo-ligase
MPESIHDLKVRLRRKALDQRRAADASWRRKASAHIAAHVLALPAIQSAATVAAFASFGHEVFTWDLIGELIARKGSVALPCTDTVNRRLDFRRVTTFPDGCIKGFGGILEPNPLIQPETVPLEVIDCFLVPGLLFDRTGYRLGYGGGYYDRILAQAPDSISIALAFGFQLVDALPHDAHDRPVQIVCTEDGTIVAS